MNDDMRQTIVPKSDQLNADDLIGREMTIKITGVTVKGGQEQPVSISFEGDDGKPYKACKSMCRVMVSAWGADSSKYTGRSMTLYRDPTVKWGGMAAGGIRISHMTDIAEDMTMALTVTRANKKPYTVKPLRKTAKEPAATGNEGETKTPASESLPSQLSGQTDHVAAATISDPQRKRLEARISEVGIALDKVKKYIKKHYSLDHFKDMNAEQYDVIDAMLDDYVLAQMDKQPADDGSINAMKDDKI